MSHFPDDREMFWLNHSMTQWERYTCVRFRPAGPDDQNFVKFQSGDGYVIFKPNIYIQIPIFICMYISHSLYEEGHSLCS